MSDNSLTADIGVLLTVGVVLLQFGLSMIQAGQIENGIFVVILGTALIFAAAFLIKYFIVAVIRHTPIKKPVGINEHV